MSGGRIALIGIGAVATIVVLVVVLYLTVWHTAEPRGALSAREQIIANAGFRISAYNNFFDKCAYVKSQQAKLENNWEALQEMEAAGIKESDPDRYWKKFDEYTAIANTVETGCNSYTADANKKETVGKFKEVCLPESLDPQDAVQQAKEGGRIECECEGWQQGPY